ncbi:MAG: GIY-YIG nuclease family protein [Betaproteobacteria bacterium]|nr:GIY-YIG nuclease family protein [Betaproteobacteria bacterium]
MSRDKAPSRETGWVLYLIECEGGRFYTGITNDLERRFEEHCAGVGARYTRMYPPVRVVAIREFPDRSSASKAEASVKKLPRPEKPAYFAR